MPGAHKIGAAISGPRIAGGNFMDITLFLKKRGRFDENGENDEFACYPKKTRVWLLRLPKTTKMTKMAGVTQEKAWFRKGRVCSSLMVSS